MTAGGERVGPLSPGSLRSSPSIVGSYSSTKWLWISWIVKQDFPTPPPPTTTSLYSRRNYRGAEGGCQPLVRRGSTDEREGVVRGYRASSATATKGTSRGASRRSESRGSHLGGHCGNLWSKQGGQKRKRKKKKGKKRVPSDRGTADDPGEDEAEGERFRGGIKGRMRFGVDGGKKC